MFQTDEVLNEKWRDAAFVVDEMLTRLLDIALAPLTEDLHRETREKIAAGTVRVRIEAESGSPGAIAVYLLHERDNVPVPLMVCASPGLQTAVSSSSLYN